MIDETLKNANILIVRPEANVEVLEGFWPWMDTGT